MLVNNRLAFSCLRSWAEERSCFCFSLLCLSCSRCCSLLLASELGDLFGFGFGFTTVGPEGGEPPLLLLLLLLPFPFPLLVLLLLEILAAELFVAFAVVVVVVVVDNVVDDDDDDVAVVVVEFDNVDGCFPSFGGDGDEITSIT